MRLPVFGVVIALWLAAAAPPGTAVRVWQDTLQIPTYGEGPANPNPPFDLFSFGRFNYPYPMRDALTNQRAPVSWRTLNLENEYLRLTVLPDLGGHIYSCIDKRSGRDMFYSNTAIKKALIGYRGAWAALGVEFNFPVSHNWMSVSPVDFATGEHDDGSASIWVGNVDRLYGSQWRVELRLAPGESVLRQNVELYNRSDVRHRYYWWSNGAVRVWDDSHLEYPTELMASHGFTRIQRWPVDDKGRDLSVIRNETDGPVSLFTYGTREPFVGVYHPHTNSGTIHVADPAELPVHKFWSWGYDRDAADWRQALSDDDSGYVELQAGLFRNQETYAFLEPQESVRFSEFWLPVRDLGGITRANTDGVLSMTRTAPGRVHLALDVTRDVPDAHITVRDGSRSALDSSMALSPREVWRADVDNVTSAPLTFQLANGRGVVLMTHTENRFDRTPAAGAAVGPQPDMRASGSPAGSASEILERGQTDELEGRRLQAMDRYREGLKKYPHTVALLKAAGRLAVALGWPEANTGPAPSAIAWLEEAQARNTTDAEVNYYLGLALEGAGRPGDARRHLEAAARFRGTRTQAALQLARLSARAGDIQDALHCLHSIDNGDPRTPLAAELQVALLRLGGGAGGARERARNWRTVDPTSGLLRNELAAIGEPDADLWAHFGADATRVLDVVDQYLTIGAYDDALALLERKYPAVESPMREPGAVPPDRSPLIAYYRGYVHQQRGADPRPDYEAARRLPTTYVFPMRHSSYAVLRSALQIDQNDTTARFLLGSLYLSAGLVQPAIDEWERARAARPPIPTLHRNLGLALLYGPGDYAKARSVLEEGLTADPSNVEIYTTLDGVLSAAGANPRQRVAALRRFPAAVQMPSAMTFELALALAEAGEAGESEQLFHNRFFPREEGGTNVRAVYAQARLASAAAAAAKKDCAAALGILDSLSHEQPGLAFTAGGLADALRPPQVAQQDAAIESACGRLPAARARWEQLERGFDGRGGPIAVAIADQARERLGHPRTQDQRQLIENALAGVTHSLETGDTSSPGFTEYTRALLLRALGRPEEAERSLKRVFMLPDRYLSHALARTSRAR